MTEEFDMQRVYPGLVVTARRDGSRSRDIVRFDMDPIQVTLRGDLQQAIDAEINSLEESIRALRYRRNALAPVSSLPTEAIRAIFSFLRLPGTSPLAGASGEPDYLAWL